MYNLIIVDNSALSSLNRVGHLEILLYLFGTLVIPGAVLDEFIKSHPHDKLDKRFEIKNVEIVDLNLFIAKNKDLEKLGKGDQEIMYLAFNKGNLIITDDKKVKSCCQYYGIAAIGTLRLLKNAYTADYFKSKEEYFIVIDEVAKDLYLSKELINWAKQI